MQSHQGRLAPFGICACDPADESDREVDLADQQDEDDAVGEQAGARHLRDDVREVAGCEEVLRRLAEDDDDDREREHHRPAAEVSRPDRVAGPLVQRLELGGLDLRRDRLGRHAPTVCAVPGMPDTFVGMPAVIACTTSS
jgi:hypothetical protein